MTFAWPTTTGPESVRPTRRYGDTSRGHVHRGVDLGKAGDLVLAAAPGKVLIVAADLPGPGSFSLETPASPVPRALGPGGIMVYVDHGAGWVTRYMHLASWDVLRGDVVTAGQQLGEVGRTGFRAGSTTAPHLHFEAVHDGAHVDPLPLLEPPLSRDPAIAGFGVAGVFFAAAGAALLLWLLARSLA